MSSRECCCPTLPRSPDAARRSLAGSIYAAVARRSRLDRPDAPAHGRRLAPWGVRNATRAASSSSLGELVARAGCGLLRWLGLRRPTRLQLRGSSPAYGHAEVSTVISITSRLEQHWAAAPSVADALAPLHDEAKGPGLVVVFATSHVSPLLSSFVGVAARAMEGGEERRGARAAKPPVAVLAIDGPTHAQCVALRQRVPPAALRIHCVGVAVARHLFNLTIEHVSDEAIPFGGRTFKQLQRGKVLALDGVTRAVRSDVRPAASPPRRRRVAAASPSPTADGPPQLRGRHA